MQHRLLKLALRHLACRFHLIVPDLNKRSVNATVRSQVVVRVRLFDFLLMRLTHIHVLFIRGEIHDFFESSLVSFNELFVLNFFKLVFFMNFLLGGTQRRSFKQMTDGSFGSSCEIVIVKGLVYNFDVLYFHLFLLLLLHQVADGNYFSILVFAPGRANASPVLVSNQRFTISSAWHLRLCNSLAFNNVHSFTHRTVFRNVWIHVLVVNFVSLFAVKSS